MKQKLGTTPLKTPPDPAAKLSSTGALIGHPIPPIERIRLFSAAQWEDFILEWVDSLRTKYIKVEKCAGAGDMGRDIVAYTDINSDEWDNFQCKHYSNALTPSDIWIELGKLAYYTKRGDYSVPNHYYFVAPHGAGTKLSNLLKKPTDLKNGLIQNWDKYCRDSITITQPVALNKDLLAHLESLDFTIFSATSPLKIVAEHSMTPWFVFRFGGGLPERPIPLCPPDIPDNGEITYVRALLEAYSDHLKTTITAIDKIPAGNLRDHFKDSRTDFYCAESLRTFSRDTLPPGEFESLLEEIYSGVIDEVRSNHVDGYKRVLAATKTAKLLQLSKRALTETLTVRDRGGMCHQLANNNKINWTQD